MCCRSILAFYYIHSQEENTDIGKNMYANWNIDYASEKKPWCALIGACAVNMANTVSKFSVCPR